MMNIAYLTPVVYPYTKGGVEKRIYEVSNRLADRGHQITIYSREWWENDHLIETPNNIEFIGIGPPRDLYSNGDRRSIKRAISFTLRSSTSLVKDNKDHDVIISPIAPYLHTLPLNVFGMVNDIPIIITWHEVWNDYWYEYMGSIGVTGKTIEQLCALAKHYPVVPSETTAAKLASLMPIDRNIELIPNGIDWEWIQTVPEHREKCDILYVGRLINDKNVDLLIKSMKGLEDNIKLTIIGDGPQKETLVSLASDLEIHKQVDFLGFLEDYEDVIRYMKKSTVFASPSIREGFGITILESMAANCRVVTVSHPNSAASEVVGNAGFVVDPNEDSVREGIKIALGSKPLPRDPVNAAKKYRWSKITSMTERYLKEVCGL